MLLTPTKLYERLQNKDTVYVVDVQFILRLEETFFELNYDDVKKFEFLDEILTTLRFKHCRPSGLWACLFLEAIGSVMDLHTLAFTKEKEAEYAVKTIGQYLQPLWDDCVKNNDCIDERPDFESACKKIIKKITEYCGT